jgi:hypothetical protein
MLLFAQEASAQVLTEPDAAVLTAPETPVPGGLAADPPPGPARVEKLTPVVLDILDPVGSKISKSLDTFRIALAEPLMVGGKVAVAAGTPGQGEIVHAKKAGGMGAAGELVIAARFLEIDGRRVPLRSTRLDAAGKSNLDRVGALAVASAASPIPVAVIGFFIKGGEIELPAGTRVSARLAEDFVAVSAPEPARENRAAPAAAKEETGGKNE